MLALLYDLTATYPTSLNLKPLHRHLISDEEKDMQVR